MGEVTKGSMEYKDRSIMNNTKNKGPAGGQGSPRISYTWVSLLYYQGSIPRWSPEVHAKTYAERLYLSLPGPSIQSLFLLQ